jgi:hypothetical protein
MDTIGGLLKKGAEKVKGTILSVADQLDHILDDETLERGGI